jgi:predicted nucleic acid-binding protein
MERQNYLIDTNAIIDYLGNKIPYNGMQFLNTVIDAIPNISIITKIEVLGFNTTKSEYKLLANFMDDANVIELSKEVADICIDLRKRIKIKLPDAIIASTALAKNSVLITRNSADFRNVAGLTVIDPHSY